MAAGSFTKLFSSITASTIWCEPSHIRIVWITMLAMANRKGEVAGSIPGLAGMARVDVDDCREAIKRFLAPDPDSRTKAFEGRRIEEIEGGWRLLNYLYYREIQDVETVKDTKRKWWQENRGLDKTRQTRHHSTQAEAEGEGEGEALKTTTAPQASPAARGTRFSGQVLEKEWEAFCKATRPDLNPAAVFAGFQDYWVGVAGAKGVKLSWLATWRNWVRNQKGVNGSAHHAAAIPADGGITCRACNKRVSSHTQYICDQCYREGKRP